MSEKILFLTFHTFSVTGGIQKMSRTLAHSLHQLCQKYQWSFELQALYDQPSDLLPAYLPASEFRAFGKNRIKFVWNSLKAGRKADIVILSHVHLSVIGCMLRLLNPKCKIWLITHGIEVWRPLGLWQKAIWKICDKIICVSRFTRRQVIARHGADPERCFILNNALDPFLPLPETFQKPSSLLARYQIRTGQKVILTLSRISSEEKFKGYEQVIKVLSRIKRTIPSILYLLAGPYDAPEKADLDRLIAVLGLQNNVILTGYIEEQELAAHFLLADLFVLPSKKEGFGMVLMEAMAFGLPVICGNADGSTDAVRNAEMGTAIDPDNLEALEEAMMQKLTRQPDMETRKDIQRQCWKYFNAQQYRDTLEKLIKEEIFV